MPIVTALALIAAAPLSPAAPAAVAIPFAPPLDQPIRYRQTTQEVRDGRTRKIGLPFTIRFTRSGTAFALLLRYDELPDQVMAHVGPVAALLLEPAAFRLDANGRIVAMIDEANFLKRVEAAIQTMLPDGGDPSVFEATRAYMAAMIAQLRGLPEERRLAVLAKNVLPIVAMAGRAVTAAPAESEEIADTTLGPAKQVVRTVLESAASGTARVVTSTAISPSEADALIARAKPEGDTKPIRAAIAGDATHTAYTVSTTTGLAGRIEVNRTMAAIRGGAIKTITWSMTLEKLD